VVSEYTLIWILFVHKVVSKGKLWLGKSTRSDHIEGEGFGSSSAPPLWYRHIQGNWA
jgi:hypothetical protein